MAVKNLSEQDALEIANAAVQIYYTAVEHTAGPLDGLAALAGALVVLVLNNTEARTPAQQEECLEDFCVIARKLFKLFSFPAHKTKVVVTPSKEPPS